MFTPRQHIEFNNPRTLVDAATGRAFVLGSTDGKIYEYSFADGQFFEVVDADGTALTVPTNARIALDTKRSVAYAVDLSTSQATVLRFRLAGSTPALTSLDVSTDAPSNRTGAALAFVSEKNNLFVFGGADDNGSLFQDLWRFDLRSRNWTQLQYSTDAPSAREDAGLISLGGNVLYVLGGQGRYGEVSTDTAWGVNVGGTVAKWTRPVSSARAALSLDTPSIPTEYNPDAPTLYELKGANEENYKGRLVQVKLDNPANNLKLVAVPSLSSNTARYGATSEEKALSLYLHKGETWKIAVVPREDEIGPEEDRTYALSVVEAEKGEKLKRIPAYWGTRFDVSGSYIYVADWNAFKVYQRNVDSIDLIANVSMRSAIDIVVDGDYAYVADFFNGLRVFDISNPLNPQLVASEWVLGFVDSITKIGDYIYLGAGCFGVQSVNVSQPTNPYWEDVIWTCDVVVDVSSAGGLLMVGTLFGGVDLYSTDGQGSLVALGAYSSLGWVLDTAFYGGKMYVRTCNDSVEVVDLSDPANPTFIETISGGRKEVSMRTGDDIMVKPNALGDLKVFDVATVEEAE